MTKPIGRTPSPPPGFDQRGPNPGGLCGCGCGRQTRIANRNDYRDGVAKGQPYRFVRGHHSRLRPLKPKLKNGHVQARRDFELTPCEECGAEKTERHHKDDDPNNNAPENIAILCRRCHMKADGRLERFRDAAASARGRGRDPDTARDGYGRFAGLRENAPRVRDKEGRFT